MTIPARLKRRPFLTPIWLSGLMALFIFAVLAVQAWIWFTAESATIILVRPAETAQSDGGDPPLAAAGEARAAQLAKLLGHTGASGQLDAIYVAPVRRSRMTAAPLAAELGLVPIVAAAGDPPALAKRILREHSGRKVLVVGDGVNGAALAAVLTGGNDLPSVRADDYGSMIIITVPRIGRTTVLHLTY